MSDKNSAAPPRTAPAVVLYLQYLVMFLPPDGPAEHALTHIWLPALKLEIP